MPRKVYPESLKEEICKRIMSSGPDHLSYAEAAKEYNINKTTLQYWVNKKHRVSMPDVESIPPAPVPANIGSIREALVVANLCEHQGFESPEAALLCQQFGVKLEEVKAFSSWADKYITDEILMRAPNLSKNVNDAQACLQNVNDELLKAKAELKKREKALAEAKMELAVRKKLEELLSK